MFFPELYSLKYKRKRNLEIPYFMNTVDIWKFPREAVTHLVWSTER